MDNLTAGNPVAHRVRVYYEGSNTIYRGMSLCYNYDTTTNWFGGSVADDGTVTASTTTAEGSQNEGKYILVEEPSKANSFCFAGVVTKGGWNGKSGPRVLDIYVPNGAIVPIYTDKNITIKDKLYLEAGENTLVNDTWDLPYVATSVETVDRGTDAGIVLAKLDGVNTDAAVELVSANSRTTVQLPTAAIWDNFDLKALRDNPFAGAYLDTDFKRSGDFPDVNYIAATYAASADGKSPTEEISTGTANVGEIDFFTTTDNQGCEGLWNCPITVSGGANWGFECRIKVSEVSAAQNNIVGLILPQKLVGDLISDTAAIADGGFVGFQKKEGDPNVYDFVFDESGQTQNEHDDDYVTITSAYVTLGMYFNGTTIQGYLNGISTGTAISASEISAADFPTAAILVPVVAVKAGDAADYTVTLDWLRVAQSP